MRNLYLVTIIVTLVFMSCTKKVGNAIEPIDNQNVREIQSLNDDKCRALAHVIFEDKRQLAQKNDKNTIWMEFKWVALDTDAQEQRLNCFFKDIRPIN